MKLRFALLVVLLIGCLPLAAQQVYTNGPINGSIQAYSFSGNSGWQSADSFVVGASTTVTGFSIGAWVLPGDQPLSTGWEILTGGPDWMGGTVIAKGIATFSNVYWGKTSGYFADYFDIYTSTVTGLDVPLAGGTYWLELLNGTTEVSGNPIYWDENQGPSTAYQNQGVGLIGSEAFTINGKGDAQTVPEPPSLLLFGSGMIGLSALIRRKIGL
ncbi:MAG TPA: PEP-CTERM sorting domain-containing protein [Terriglobales bacterium]|nr:PEP-CTERM sorting domain-containing protein [Terriglobales bacterium]